MEFMPSLLKNVMAVNTSPNPRKLYNLLLSKSKFTEADLIFEINGVRNLGRIFLQVF